MLVLPILFSLLVLVAVIGVISTNEAFAANVCCETVSFSHSDDGPEADCLQNNVCLWRDVTGPIVVIDSDEVVIQFSTVKNLSPVPVEWAAGMCSSPTGPFGSMKIELRGVIGDLLDLPGEDTCLKVGFNFYDIHWNSWGSDSGGSFSYTRDAQTPPVTVTPPPPEVTLTGDFDQTTSGVPVIVSGTEISYTWDDPGVCGSGIEATSVTLQLGPFLDSGLTHNLLMTLIGPNEWETTSSVSDSGEGALNFVATCPDSSTPIHSAGGLVFIDPSGQIFDSCTSQPLEGATVTLLHDIGFGFETAPAATPPLIPAVNPQTTSIDGKYAWDVIAGSYKVMVEKAGYTTTESAVLTIPPPVVGLDFTLQRIDACPVPITVGGIFIPIDQSALLLAGVQSVSMWMIPIVIAGIGIGIFVIKRRN